MTFFWFPIAIIVSCLFAGVRTYLRGRPDDALVMVVAAVGVALLMVFDT